MICSSCTTVLGGHRGGHYSQLEINNAECDVSDSFLAVTTDIMRLICYSSNRALSFHVSAIAFIACEV